MGNGSGVIGLKANSMGLGSSTPAMVKSNILFAKNLGCSREFGRTERKMKTLSGVNSALKPRKYLIQPRNHPKTRKSKTKPTIVRFH